MRRSRLEVAEVFRSYKDAYLARYPASPLQRRVMDDIVACRSALLGGHILRCRDCGHEEISYNSCRNRHCPKCQAQKQALWLEAQCARLLEVPYYHIVFTLPTELGPLALQNKETLYGLLFRAAAQTLLTIARDPKHLGAKIGFSTVLHSWGQTLLHHPHLHCVVPAGGLAPDGSRWITAKKQFFLPVRVLSRLFREKYLSSLRRLYREHLLLLEGRLQDLKNPERWKAFLQPLEIMDWVVYAKPPFGSSLQVLKYLARYTNRVAISNRRLVKLDDGKVNFTYKDYKQNRPDCVMRLDALEFMRRFLLHVLPKGFVRIRHYGFLANRNYKTQLPLCRRLIAETIETETYVLSPPEPVASSGAERCPVCGKGPMIVMANQSRIRAGPAGDIRW